MLPGILGPGAGRINLEIFLPGGNSQVPYLDFFICDSKIVERAGAFLIAQLWEAQNLVQ